MEPKELYGKLQRLAELEERISEKDEVKFGDPDCAEHSRLVESFPLLSLEDVYKYHKCLEDVSVQAEQEMHKREGKLRKKILDVLRAKCSPSAYTAIEISIERIFGV